MLSLVDIWAAGRWWLALSMMGAATLPLTWTLFRRLPDRGYAFTRLVGVLGVSYLFWMSGSLGWLRNDLGGILVALVAAAAGSWWIYRRRPPAGPGGDRGPGLLAWLRQSWRHVLLTEAVFLVIFALWVWVRAQNPAIAATEKPMEFAFLNGVGRSAVLPPLDPWLSGYAISYYYFGYVMTSVIARLAAVPEFVAFNLGIAWLVAGSAVAAFGLVYNLVIGLAGTPAAADPDPVEPSAGRRSARRLAAILAVAAAVALPIAGNQQISLEVLHGNGIGSDRLWAWLDVRDINGPAASGDAPRYLGSDWWWWRASRVIHEYHLSGRAEEGLEPIAEFPGFSFVLGDMHPHVLALPFAFLSLALAYLWYLAGDEWVPDTPVAWSTWRQGGSWGGVAERRPPLGLWAASALVLGGLSFLNTWDVLIHLGIMVGAAVLARWRRHGWRRQHLVAAVVLAIQLVLPAVVLYLPFYLGFRSQAGAPYLLPMLMRPTRLAHYLVIFAMPLIGILGVLGALAFRSRRRHWRSGLAAAAGVLAGLLILMLLLGWIVASSASGAWRVTELASELGLALPPRPAAAVTPLWGARAVLALLPPLLAARLTAPGMTLLLALLLALVVSIWRRQMEEVGNEMNPASAGAEATGSLPFVLLLVLAGALLTLAPEFVYLRDNFGVRLNTIFKFYYQAWVMFGVAGLCALGYLWLFRRRVAIPVTAVYGVTLALALLFPFHAIRARTVEYRGPVAAADRLPATLDGLAQLRQFRPAEYEAIQWLRQNVAGAPVVLEAVGGQYSEFGRIAASTGLPTVLGWAGHQYQWRGSDHPEPGRREADVRQIYADPASESARALLDRYRVAYVFVGDRERATYGEQNVQKFGDLLQVAYRNDSVVIYRWQPDP